MSVIKRKSERSSVEFEHRFDGPGIMRATKIIDSDEELNGKGRMFNEIVLEKDCGIGFHVHEGDGEIFLILSGEAEYED